MQRSGRVYLIFGFVVCVGSACSSADCPPGTALVQERCVELMPDSGMETSTDGAENAESHGGSGGSDGGEPSDRGEATTGHSGSQSEHTNGRAGSSGGAGGSGGSLASMAGSGASGSGDGGGPAPMEQKEPCTTDGEVRCSTRATGQRDKCTGGVWIETDACATGQTCTTASATVKAGGCAAIAEVCRGSGGQPVCDGRGVMYLCNSDGVAESMLACDSATLCNMGLAGKACLKCVPGEHRCTDVSLEVCKDDGSGFTEEKKCPTAALCNATLGDCTAAACVPGKKVCDKDTLKECNPDQTALQQVKKCTAGLCDNKNGECDVCVTGAKTCEGDTAVICNATGQANDRMACGGGTPRCVGAGTCVECTSDDDCGDPGTCKTKFCNVSTGMCQPKNAPSRARCEGSKLCDGSGGCVTCLEDDDCGDPGTCKTKFCNTTSHTCAPKNAPVTDACTAGHCNGAGTCVQCMNAGECDQFQCKNASCTSDGTCTYANSAPGTKSTCSGTQVCDGGSCYDCVTADQCKNLGFDQVCSRAACVEHHCMPQAKNGEKCDSLMICKGTTCSSSCGDSVLQTITGEACDPGLTSTWSCDEKTCQLTGRNDSTAGKNCTAGTDCGPKEVCDSTWFGSGLCLPACNAATNTCELPSGYESVAGCNSATPTATSGCLIACGAGKKPCPGGGTCSNPSATGFCLHQNN